jgi:hypothetical protein
MDSTTYQLNPCQKCGEMAAYPTDNTDAGAEGTEQVHTAGPPACSNSACKDYQPPASVRHIFGIDPLRRYR